MTGLIRRPDARKHQRQGGIAIEVELRDSRRARSRERASGGEDQVAVLKFRRAPFQEGRRGCGLAVLISADESRVEPIAQVSDAVSLAPKKPAGDSGAKDQPEVIAVKAYIDKDRGDYRHRRLTILHALPDLAHAPSMAVMAARVALWRKRVGQRRIVFNGRLRFAAVHMLPHASAEPWLRGLDSGFPLPG